MPTEFGPTARRVVVTGLGILSGFGSGRAAFEHGLFEGKSAIRPINGADASEPRWRFGATVAGFSGDGLVRKSELHYYDRVSLMAIAAADEALQQAGLDQATIGSVTGVMLGTGFGPAQAIQESIVRAQNNQRLRPTSIVKMMLNSPTAALCARYGLQKASTAHVTACAASAHAIAQGATAVQRGDMDLCLAGGSEAYPTSALEAAWDALGVLSTEADTDRGIVRPFARDRCGFVIGEAATVLVLEAKDRAEARGARILAEWVGAGAVSDTPGPTKPTLAGMMGAMRAAMDQAQLTPHHVGHINAHGTATDLNDRLETEAIERLFGDHAPTLCISASKAALGHCMGAGGAVEAAATILALQRQEAPPTLGLNHPDPGLTLNYCPRVAHPMRTEYALSNSFAFGGHYVTLAFRSRAGSPDRP